MTDITRSKQLRWIRDVNVPAFFTPRISSTTTRERIVAMLADRPRTVAQLAQGFGMSQPSMLEQVRRALADELIVEVEVPEHERRFARERYYAPTVPVVRQADRDLLGAACDAIAGELAGALERNQADLQAAFAMTHLAREGWTFADLWPYLSETIMSRALESFDVPSRFVAHGLSWIEEIDDFSVDDASASVEEELA